MVPRAVEAGFTLVEMLVSMVVLALVMGLVALSLNVISSGWERGGRAAGFYDMVGRANDLIRRDLAGAKRIFDKAAKTPTLLFRGSERSLTYIVREPPYPSQPGLYVVRLSIVSDGKGANQLIRSRKRYRATVASTMFGEVSTGPKLLEDRVVLIDRADGPAFSYKADEPGAAWETQWTDSKALPRLVRIVFGGAGPAIVARAGVEAAPGCANAAPGICNSMKRGRPQDVGEKNRLSGQRPSVGAER